MTKLERCFRLADEPGSLGLSCGLDGLTLAGAPLLSKTSAGFAPRPKLEIDALMASAYGTAPDSDAVSGGLRLIAKSLNQGDLGRAMIGALQLRLPELSWAGAVRIARADCTLSKFNYDPNEPRDWRGRWTTGDTGGPTPAAGNSRAKPVPAPPVRRRPGLETAGPKIPSDSRIDAARPTPVSDSSGNWSTHLWGGRLIQTGGEFEPGIGDNGPPPETTTGVPEAEPDWGYPQIPQGWDKPGYTENGLYYPPSRDPTLPNGKPWPRATADLLKILLAKRPDGRPPTVFIYVPPDGIGPPLMGGDETVDYEEPRGYSRVLLIGTPQVTMSRGVETGHAADSIREALRLAGSNEFSIIYFNTSYSIVTGRTVVSLLRPDVFAVVRPDVDRPYRYAPYETLSPGQTKEEREQQLPRLPYIRDLEVRSYKREFRHLSPERLAELGVRYVC